MEFKHHLGVYAVILNEARDHVLLIKKARGPYTGLWDLPGGSLEPDELIEDALTREILEETACTAMALLQLGAVSVRYPFTDLKDGIGKVLRHVGILYAADVTGTPSKAGDALDLDGAFWHPLAKLDNTKVTPFMISGLQSLKNPGEDTIISL